jgi:lipopolysaccharide transport system ATP-binding protein
MCGDVVIRAEGLGKKYVVGHKAERERYVALRDVLARSARSGWRKMTDMLRGRPIVAGHKVEEFWALRDVSFAVERGEVLGVIGRNGAGKSTLLKVLSRITEPSVGRVTIKGRVASLLEVGTGFHPELTGRENIYLNGAILGMTRGEIRKKFDEIVAFAEVERFLDTPVKRYSSGMHFRLAFAVAAHLEPEILVVDEVLAVGDAEFQRKCLGKMSQVAGGGRTVLFVSHNMAAVEALCPRSIHLESGEIVGAGETAGIVAAYLEQRRDGARRAAMEPRRIEQRLVIEQVEVVPSRVRSGDRLQIDIHFRALAPGRLHACALLIFSIKGTRIAVVDPRERGKIPLSFLRGGFTLSFRLASLPLVEGEFTVGLYLVSTGSSGEILDLASFSVFEPSRADFVPYLASDRGSVVLDVEISTHVDERLGTVP